MGEGRNRDILATLPVHGGWGRTQGLGGRLRQAAGTLKALVGTGTQGPRAAGEWLCSLHGNQVGPRRKGFLSCQCLSEDLPAPSKRKAALYKVCNLFILQMRTTTAKRVYPRSLTGSQGK